MKCRLLSLLALALAVGPALADGLIIVHDPFPMPRIPPPHPVPPPWPGPRPPQPPPPRPAPPPPRVYTFAPLAVRYHHVDIKVRDQVAVTAVDQEFYNPNDRTLEGTYIFPVPKGAQLDKFSMDINGQPVAAELLPAEKARKIYEDIVRQHRDPALLEYVGRDTFKVRIFPIEPHSKKRVQLSYTQVLPADAGLVRYLYPLNTEKFSAQPLASVRLALDLEAQRALKSIYSPSHKVEIQRHGDHRATVRFEASQVRPDTDFQLFFALEPGPVGLNLMTYRTGADAGYFLLLAAPAFDTRGEPAQPKDVALVLDTSGSMAGQKLQQAKLALRFCVENLNDADRFEVIRFSTETEPLFGKLVPAERANRERAAQFIANLRPIGGTAIHDALQLALAARPTTHERPYLVIFLTDGRPTVGATDTDAIVAAVKGVGQGAPRIFCFGLGHDVNTHLLDRIAETTHASSAYVLPDEDLEVKLSNFYAKVKDPVLANLKLIFPADIRPTQLYPSPLPDLFRGEQLVLAGRYTGPGRGQLALEGTVQGKPRRFEFDAQFPGNATEHEFIPRLWATRRIGFLLDEIRLRGESAELRDEVSELARQYGIVTPYTAYLIHEDEQRRRVPLAQQSLPQFDTDRAAFELSRQSYDAFKQDTSGAAAVAAARYGLANRAATQVAEALAQGNAEADRSLRMMLRAGSVAPSRPTPAAPQAPFLATAPAPSGGTPVVTAPAPARSAGLPDATAVATPANILEYTQQNRFVNGRTFFLNGNQWVDTRVQTLSQPKQVRIPFNSAEYFDLLLRNAEVRPWLALGQNVQFVLGDTVIEVYE
ncbi:MAG: VWA domain-containing protein [Verrucomicrobia bacterium]|nr:VWA domain-containing protein [Verrucomicrobiota bacterium]